MLRLIFLAGVCCWMLALAVAGADQAGQSAPAAGRAPRPARPVDHKTLFVTSDNCFACHNSLTTTGGEDISIATAWRSSMMANSSRDPYWQASVRRETVDHPAAAAAIEHECSTCHMPMSHAAESAGGQLATVFAHLPLDQRRKDMDLLAADGVSCAMCHQIQPDRLGTPKASPAGSSSTRRSRSRSGRSSARLRSIRRAPRS